MAQETISKLNHPIQSEIQIPGDKSISHRSVIFGSIAQGLTEVSNFLTGEDCICTMNAFKAMGVQIEFNETKRTLKIQGKGFSNLTKPTQDIYLGNSGTGMRLLTGLFAGLPFSTKLTGDASLSSRPMARVIDPLAEMGAGIESQEGKKAPLIIHPVTKLKAINYISKIASAQVKSSILLAGLNAEGITTVSEPEKSRDHTERMMQGFGADLIVDGLKVSINGSQSLSKLQGQRVEVPGDISSAAFFLVAGAILENAELKLINVGINPTRTGILDVLRSMQANFELINKREVNREPIADMIIRSSKLKACTIEGDIIPRLIDEIPVISILAAQAQGTTIIKDAAELKVKESNRIATTINMLRKLGVTVEETEDGMIIEGRAGKPFEPINHTTSLSEKLPDARHTSSEDTELTETSMSSPRNEYNNADGNYRIDSHGDHRLAMSSAIAALHSNKPITILQTEFVATSFPEFFGILGKLSQGTIVA